MKWWKLLAISLLLPSCGKSGDSAQKVDSSSLTNPTGPGGTGTGTGGGTGCVENWLCTPWETDGVSDAGTRTCTDLNGCGTTVDKPVEAATLPALDFDYYKCQVEPIFDRGCSQLGCHGAENGRALRTYSRGRLRITGETWYEPNCLSTGQPRQSEDCTGSIECVCWSIPHSPAEWRKNYDAARGFGLQNDGTPWAVGDLADSELLIQPVYGGKPHANVHLFNAGDADYNTILGWLSGNTAPPCHTGN